MRQNNDIDALSSVLELLHQLKEKALSHKQVGVVEIVENLTMIRRDFSFSPSFAFALNNDTVNGFFLTSRSVVIVCHGKKNGFEEPSAQSDDLSCSHTDRSE